MSRIDIIREWDNKRLVAELRSPVRASLAKEEDSYTLLLAEAIARILETKTIKAVREIITERDKADKLREKCAGLGIEGILEQKRLLAAEKQRADSLAASLRDVQETLSKMEWVEGRCLICLGYESGLGGEYGNQKHNEDCRLSSLLSRLSKDKEKK